jgi:hypothetical protein
MPDLIRHPENLNWFPALVPFRVFAGKTTEIVIVSIMNTIMRLLIKA